MSIAAPESRIATQPEARYLSGPITDFLMLGGSSLLLFPLLLALPGDSLKGTFGILVFWGAFAINHPHFAVSYRIFYEGFGAKVSPLRQPDTTLRYRYMFAGIIAPALLGVGVVVVALTGSRQLLAYSFNIMMFFVGWHYVKQGYGMVMVDAALKRRYLSAFEKKALLVNAYAVWAFAWTTGNNSAEPFERRGMIVSGFDVPDVVIWATGFVMAASTITALYAFGRRALSQTPTAWIGLVAYVVSLYIWMLLVRREPLMAWLTPALHSLQYLWVVRKFQKNRHVADSTKRSWGSQYFRSVLLGASFFFFIPVLLDGFTSIDVDVWGTTPFLFVFVIFINIHHYFLDNVMWRRGNAEVSEHLFA